MAGSPDLWRERASHPATLRYRDGDRGDGHADRVEFKLATSFPDVDAPDAQSVRSYPAQRRPILPTSCPTNDQGLTADVGDQATDLLVLV